ncbi:MAG: BMP family ABC transporter substrate-binding protein [Oscillospiraceae bacterium]
MQKRSLIKLISFCLASVILGTLFLAGCGKNGDGEKDLGIALITSAAGANDKGYNQSAIKGLEKVKKELGINYKVTESKDIPESLTQLAEAGYKLIFTLEYNFDALIKGVGGAKPIAEQYPDTTFVVFNDNPNKKEDGSPIHKNVVSVMFDVHEAAFLSGVLSTYIIENSATLLSPDQYNLTTGQNGRKVGFIGGTKSNGISVFSYGFAEGINYAANQLGVNYTIYSDYNAGFSDSALGATKANTYFADGANVVLSSAGAVGDGVTSKAKEVKKFAIEVDADKDANQPGYILTSVLKNTEVPVYEISKMFKENKLSEVNGKEISYNLASGATGITTLKEIEKNILPSGKAKWDEIKKIIDDAKKGIESGKIKVTNAQAGEKINKDKLTNINMPND